MPNDRLFHPRLRRSSKVTSLGWFGRCVWEDMILAADDFGVLPNHAGFLRGGSAAMLEQESEGAVGDAMTRVVAVGLFLVFEHQGREFLCDPLWQDYQKIRFPRSTYYPMPTTEILLKCSRQTSEMFQKRFRSYGRAVHRLKAKGLRLTANGKEGESEGEASTDPLLTLSGQPFKTPEALLEALDRAPHFGQDSRVRGGKFWQSVFSAYPSVDYAREIARAQSWCVANPTKAPRREFARFLNHWFQVEEDRAQG